MYVCQIYKKCDPILVKRDWPQQEALYRVEYKANHISNLKWDPDNGLIRNHTREL